MPSTYTSSLRFTLQASGENLNTWGTILNAGAFQLVDYAIAGVAALTVSGNVTLTANNGAADQARAAILSLSGSGGNITIPAVQKAYHVLNTGTGTMVFTTGTGATVSLGPSNYATIYCDGTNVYKVTQDQADVAACLAAAKAYTDSASFAAASGTLPGQAGNAGNFLTTNGTSASWAAVPQVNTANTWTAAQTFSQTIHGSIDGNAATATSASVASSVTNGAVGSAGLGSGAALANIGAGGIGSYYLGSGVAVANIGYTPFPNTGGTINGSVSITGGGGSSGSASLYAAGVGCFVQNTAFNAGLRVAAGAGDSPGRIQFTNNAQNAEWGGIQSNGYQLPLCDTFDFPFVRLTLASGSQAVNTGRIQYGTGTPGSLANGEIYLQVAAV